MQYRILFFLILVGLTSSCMMGSYPSGYPSGGQSSPDDTYPGSSTPSGNYPNNGTPSGRNRSADPGVSVNSIRLTSEYTILNLTYQY